MVRCRRSCSTHVPRPKMIVMQPGAVQTLSIETDERPVTKHDVRSGPVTHSTLQPRQPECDPPPPWACLLARDARPLSETPC